MHITHTLTLTHLLSSHTQFTDHHTHMYNMIIIISHTYIHYILINSGEDEEGEDADIRHA